MKGQEFLYQLVKEMSQKDAYQEKRLTLSMRVNSQLTIFIVLFTSFLVSMSQEEKHNTCHCPPGCLEKYRRA
jgi:heme/copper-type cytochrome/quinol oxidase subunit 3